VTQLPPYGNGTLTSGIRARVVPGINGLSMHVLEAGFEPAANPSPGRPCLLLLHGFPELAYSWRKIMVPLAAAGYHVVAPDQRGYGRTTGWDDRYDGDLDAYRLPNLVADMIALLGALGRTKVQAVIGHDFGASVAAWGALLRPDIFTSMVLMSAPFGGPPAPGATSRQATFDALATLARPRKHYQDYYCGRSADADMRHAPQGIAAFLRAYYHHKSADWTGNRPFKLAGFVADELAKMPTYYIMDRAETMAETVAKAMPSAAEIAACRWLTEPELAVYAGEFARTGFQGGLNWYRCRTPEMVEELTRHHGRTIDVPSAFVAGSSDWGIHQTPGALERMATRACTQWRGTHLIDGAGHWVQQEQPEAVVRRVLDLLRDVTPEGRS
jgi:pimeloyl-ACP methyl ester carboxylesterase